MSAKIAVLLFILLYSLSVIAGDSDLHEFFIVKGVDGAYGFILQIKPKQSPQPPQLIDVNKKSATKTYKLYACLKNNNYYLKLSLTRYNPWELTVRVSEGLEDILDKKFDLEKAKDCNSQGFPLTDINYQLNDDIKERNDLNPLLPHILSETNMVVFHQLVCENRKKTKGLKKKVTLTWPSTEGNQLILTTVVESTSAKQGSDKPVNNQTLTDNSQENIAHTLHAHISYLGAPESGAFQGTNHSQVNSSNKRKITSSSSGYISNSAEFPSTKVCATDLNRNTNQDRKYAAIRPTKRGRSRRQTISSASPPTHQDNEALQRQIQNLATENWQIKSELAQLKQMLRQKGILD